jgi:mannose-6-phosphate isomerase
MRPIALPPNLIDHFYAGGAKIAALRGIETTSTHQPEEWLAATVARAGSDTVGLARLPDGRLLRDAVAADPVAWTGSTTAAAGPADTGLLVKLLDAGQRLPVHAHPDRAFAARHLSCPYGKTEAWYVLDSTGDGAVYLGWTDDVDPDELARRRDAQDSDWMIGHLNRVEVRPGDALLVPADTAHALGEGVFVAEVQEPTDFSIVLEWSVTTSGRDDSHLGLGFDTVMPAVDHSRMPPERLAALSRHTDPAAGGADPLPVLPAEADPFFRIDVWAPERAETAALPPGFAVVLVLAGEGTLVGDDGAEPVSAGQVLAVPAAFGGWRADGDVRMLVCRPGVVPR